MLTHHDARDPTIGDTWGWHLRECLSCGNVGCCDSSKNTHATKHFQSDHHPLVPSFEPGEDWGWCYVDEVMVNVREVAALTMPQPGDSG